MKVIPAASRFVIDGEGRRTHHVLSFGPHYDPERLALGPVVAINDERLEAGAGYEPHVHAGLTIITWVVEGTLVHGDDDGEVLLRPGVVQIHHTGAGITHTERATESHGVRFLQVWLQSAAPATPALRHGAGDVIAVGKATVFCGQPELPIMGPGLIHDVDSGHTCFSEEPGPMASVAIGQALVLRLPPSRRL